jgi:beta-phosphoglucomutase-like phosphatase (HAD superfamily)
LLTSFAEVVTGEDVLLGKPDPGIYRLACKRMGIACERLLAVEDAISGIRAAIGAGLRCVGVASHETPEKLTAAGAAHVVLDFETVSLQELECILLRSDPIPRQTAAAGGS